MQRAENPSLLRHGVRSALESSRRFQAEILSCPSCKEGAVGAAGDRIACMKCGHVMEVVDDVLDLRLDRTQDSALDIASYDADHLVDPEQGFVLYQVYDQAISQLQAVPRGRVLEIGSGTGNLTYGLCKSRHFSEVHCSDISPRFMGRLQDKLVAETTAGQLYCYLFDANYFPFRNETFATVVGHSILHHLADFENAVRNAHRVLLPGGVAIFAEPVMEYHALGFLAADLILRANAMRETSALSEHSANSLAILARRGGLKTRNLLERGDAVQQYEDKFIFPTDYMRDLAHTLGFSSYRLLHRSPVHKLGSVIERRLRLQLDAARADSKELDAFKSIFNAFTDSYEPAMGPFLSPPFAYNVFVK